MGPPMLRLALVWLCFLGLYLLFAGQVDAQEGGAAVLVATIAVCLAAVQSRLARRHYALPPHLPRITAGALASLFRDMLRLSDLPLRPVSGQVIRQELQAGGETPRDAGRRAAAILATSFAPNKIVIGIEPGAMLVHRLKP